MEYNDEQFMMLALEEAQLAASHGEVPVGAVLVAADRTILAHSGNRSIRDNNPTGHAEMVVLMEAGRIAGNYRLAGTTMYVTVEPCPMCAAALVHARVERLVYGAVDVKGGGVLSRYRIGQDGLMNHHLHVDGPCLDKRCAELLKLFFQKRRNKKCGEVPKWS